MKFKKVAQSTGYNLVIISPFLYGIYSHNPKFYNISIVFIWLITLVGIVAIFTEDADLYKNEPAQKINWTLLFPIIISAVLAYYNYLFTAFSFLFIMLLVASKSDRAYKKGFGEKDG